MPSPAAAAMIAAPVSSGRCSNVRHEPRDMADTSMPDEPSGRGRRLFAGISQPPFHVSAALDGGAASLITDDSPRMERDIVRDQGIERCTYCSASFGGAVASQPAMI